MADERAERSEAALAVVDIDGVVADVRHRLHFVERAPKDWNAFFAAAPADPPIERGVDYVRDLAARYDLVFLTGRPERCRRDTERWLAANGLGGHPLVMRRAGDRRPARQAKREALRSFAAGRTVAVVLDDDPEVVATLEADGWPVELATWVPHPKTLTVVQEREGRS